MENDKFAGYLDSLKKYSDENPDEFIVFECPICGSLLICEKHLDLAAITPYCDGLMQRHIGGSEDRLKNWKKALKILHKINNENMHEVWKMERK